jgi:phosphate transport system substrate-binding protein
MFRLVVILSILTVIISCRRDVKKDKFTDTPTTGEATIAVDETFRPVIDSELPVFHAMYKYAKIHPSYKSEVDAINLLLKDSVRLAIVTRPLTNKEMDFFHARKFFPKEVKIALDGIAVLVNPANPDTIFSMEVLRKIMLGEITSWKQLNPSSKLGKIRVIFDNPGSSTVRFVVDSITKTGNLGKQLGSMENNVDVVDYVSRNPESIGLIGVSWVSDRDDPKCLSFLDKVKVASICKSHPANPDESFQPFQAFIATGKYPLTRYLYAILTEPRVGLGSGFTSFVASDKGQRIILKTGIVPYTQPVRIVNIKSE